MNWPVLVQEAPFSLSQLDPFQPVLQLQDFPETKKLKPFFQLYFQRKRVLAFKAF